MRFDLRNVVITLIILLPLFVARHLTCSPAFAETSLAIDEEPEAVKEYRAFLKKLNPSKKESILPARDMYLKMFSEINGKGYVMNQEIAEKGFRVFRKFYIGIVENLNENSPELDTDPYNELGKMIGWEESDLLKSFHAFRGKAGDEFEKKYSKEIALLDSYRNNGLKLIDSSEGVFVIGESYRFLEDIIDNTYFLKYSNLIRYIWFLKEEFEQTIGGDGTISLSSEELRLRIIRWDEFAKYNKGMPEIETEVIPNIIKYLDMYFIGGSNEWVFSDGGTLSEEAKSSYEAFIALNQSSTYYPLVKSAYSILKKHDFMFNDEYIEYLKKYVCVPWENDRLYRKGCKTSPFYYYH